MPHKIKPAIPWAIFFALLIAADQAAKYHVRAADISYTQHNKSIWLIVLALIYLAYWAWSEADIRRAQSKLAITLVAAGGASNLIDLATQNFITNILAIHNFQFNLADLFIIIGLIIILVPLFSTPGRENRP